MRNRTFYWFRIPEGLLSGAATPCGTIVLARGAGDAGSEARRFIVELYHRDVRDYVRSLAHDVHAADDIAQDFAAQFLDAHVYSLLDQKKGSFRAYLKEWIRNAVHSRRLKASRKREVPLAGVDAPERGKPPDQTLDILLTRTRITEVRERTRVAIEGFPHAWEAFDEWYFQRNENDGLTHEKLAERLGVSPRALENLLHRARQAFTLQFVGLVAREVGDPEQMIEEVGITRELLEKALRRWWKKARPRRPGARGAVSRGVRSGTDVQSMRKPPMRMPSSRTSARRLLQHFGLYLLARLQAHSETRSLVAAWNKALEALKAALGLSDAGSAQQVMSRAAFDIADLALGNAVRAIAGAARADLGGRAEGPHWARLFHRTPGDVVRLPFAEKIEEVKRIESEVASGAMWKAAKSLLAALKAAREAMEKANTEYRAAVVASENADRKLAEAADQWRREYRAVFGGLTERLPGDRNLVESFFWRRESRAEALPTAPSAPAAPLAAPSTTAAA